MSLERFMDKGASNKLFEDLLRFKSPHTLKSFQDLVMSMAKVTQNLGKTSLFGRDKGVEAYREFLGEFRKTMHAMLKDGLVTEATPAEEFAIEMASNLETFARAFPNWKDAYDFAATIFNHGGRDAIDLIEQIRALDKNH